MNDCKGNVYQIGMGCCVPVIANPNAYYTKSEVDEKIAEIETEGISEERAQELIDSSLTDYYTKAEVDGFVDNLEDADTALGGRIDTLSQDLTTEALRASTAESGLDNKIDTVNNTIQTQIQSIETELSGDYATKEYVGNYTYDKQTIDDKISEGGTFDPTQYYNKTATDTLLNAKADKSTTYTKTEVDTELSAKANASDVYTKTATDTLLNDKANSSDVYTKTEVDTALASKADSSDLTSHTSNATIHVTSAEKTTWNNKSDFSGDYNDLTNKPTIPTYTAGNGITITNNVISAKVWSGTKAQYEALTNKDADCIYLIYEA